VTSTRKKTYLLLCAALVAVPACLLVAIFNPSEYGFFPKCLFFVATGFYCPGCGATRALHHLLNGRVIQAFGMNPLLFLSLPFLAAIGLYPQLARHPSAPVIAGIALVSYGILRNVSGFSFLAP